MQIGLQYCINTLSGIRRRGGSSSCNARHSARRRCASTVALISDIALVNIRDSPPTILLGNTSLFLDSMLPACAPTWESFFIYRPSES